MTAIFIRTFAKARKDATTTWKFCCILLHVRALVKFNGWTEKCKNSPAEYMNILINYS